MTINFHKYQGTGNDFIIIANTEGVVQLDTKEIKELCDRKFGIGADGLILLEKSVHTDFKMVYFNADGKESSMCGNGGRCIVAFAREMGIIEETCVFEAIDGLHKAKIDAEGIVKLQMKDVNSWQKKDKDLVFDTGSPHYVKFCKDLSISDFVDQARDIRNSKDFQEKGINVNFVKVEDNRLSIRTYERGVEDETLSCGTGVVAAALSNAVLNDHDTMVEVKTRGGELNVSFEKGEKSFTNIWLEGMTGLVFKGSISLK